MAKKIAKKWTVVWNGENWQSFDSEEEAVMLLVTMRVLDKGDKDDFYSPTQKDFYSVVNPDGDMLNTKEIAIAAHRHLNTLKYQMDKIDRYFGKDYFID